MLYQLVGRQNGLLYGLCVVDTFLDALGLLLDLCLLHLEGVFLHEELLVLCTDGSLLLLELIDVRIYGYKLRHITLFVEDWREGGLSSNLLAGTGAALVFKYDGLLVADTFEKDVAYALVAADVDDVFVALVAQELQCIAEEPCETGVHPFEIAVAIHNDNCILCLARHDGKFFEFLVDAFELLCLFVYFRLLLVELHILSAERNIGAGASPYRPDDEYDKENNDNYEYNHASELSVLLVHRVVLSLELRFLLTNPFLTFIKVLLTFLKLVVGFVNFLLLMVDLRLLAFKLLLDEGELRLLRVHLSHKDCSVCFLIVDFFLFLFQLFCKLGIFLLELLIFIDLIPELYLTSVDFLLLRRQSFLFCLEFVRLLIIKYTEVEGGTTLVGELVGHDAIRLFGVGIVDFKLLVVVVKQDIEHEILVGRSTVGDYERLVGLERWIEAFKLLVCPVANKENVGGRNVFGAAELLDYHRPAIDAASLGEIFEGDEFFRHHAVNSDGKFGG